MPGAACLKPAPENRLVAAGRGVLSVAFWHSDQLPDMPYPCKAASLFLRPIIFHCLHP